MISQEEVLEGQIAFLIAQRDYRVELLHAALAEGDKKKIDKFNEEIGGFNYDIGHYRRMLNERKERMQQYEQDQH